jgi:hypothetical protein
MPPPHRLPVSRLPLHICNGLEQPSSKRVRPRSTVDGLHGHVVPPECVPLLLAFDKLRPKQRKVLIQLRTLHTIRCGGDIEVEH